MGFIVKVEKILKVEMGDWRVEGGGYLSRGRELVVDVSFVELEV